ncbi:DcrB-related protein [Acanthopleuribacter pedis]|uniref:DcrB-related protein n=1 Tax=Acanthopleuribacter pedis TaxID=442870 RepID=A0A8J7U305_9BACT|nr:DcrB-related protein [Acanthopleuribacter pedis]MBO1318284.1 DcrB-related protein [Acanthopleuribacter pedis]
MMGSYYMHEGTLSIPQTWNDASRNFFTWKQGDEALTLAVIRDQLDDEDFDLEQYARDQEKKLKDQLPQFRTIEKYFDEIGNIPAFFMEFAWEPEPGRLHQFTTAFRSNNRVISLTGSVPGKMLPKHKAIFEDIFRSFTART